MQSDFNTGSLTPVIISHDSRPKELYQNNLVLRK